MRFTPLSILVVFAAFVGVEAGGGNSVMTNCNANACNANSRCRDRRRTTRLTSQKGAGRLGRKAEADVDLSGDSSGDIVPHRGLRNGNVTGDEKHFQDYDTAEGSGQTICNSKEAQATCYIFRHKPEYCDTTATCSNLCDGVCKEYLEATPACMVEPCFGIACGLSPNDPNVPEYDPQENPACAAIVGCYNGGSCDFDICAAEYGGPTNPVCLYRKEQNMPPGEYIVPCPCKIEGSENDLFDFAGSENSGYPGYFPYLETYLTLNVKTDDFPWETFWLVRKYDPNSAEWVFTAGGGFSYNALQEIVAVEIEIEPSSTYEIMLMDSGFGITAGFYSDAYGYGWWSLNKSPTTGQGDPVVAKGLGNFEDQFSTFIEVSATYGVTEIPPPSTAVQTDFYDVNQDDIYVLDDGWTLDDYWIGYWGDDDYWNGYIPWWAYFDDAYSFFSGCDYTGCFDPKAEDLDFPGPMPVSTGFVRVNVKTDDYPNEISFKWRKFVSGDFADPPVFEGNLPVDPIPDGLDYSSCPNYVPLLAANGEAAPFQRPNRPNGNGEAAPLQGPSRPRPNRPNGNGEAAPLQGPSRPRPSRPQPSGEAGLCQNDDYISSYYADYATYYTDDYWQGYYTYWAEYYANYYWCDDWYAYGDDFYNDDDYWINYWSNYNYTYYDDWASWYDDGYWYWDDAYWDGLFDDVYSWSSYDHPAMNCLVSFEIAVEVSTLYRLKLFDQYADGNCCYYGKGWWSVNGQDTPGTYDTAWYSAGEYGLSMEKFFWVDASGNVKEAVYVQDKGYAVLEIVVQEPFADAPLHVEYIPDPNKPRKKHHNYHSPPEGEGRRNGRRRRELLYVEGVGHAVATIVVPIEELNLEALQLESASTNSNTVTDEERKAKKERHLKEKEEAASRRMAEREGANAKGHPDPEGKDGSKRHLKGGENRGRNPNAEGRNPDAKGRKKKRKRERE